MGIHEQGAVSVGGGLIFRRTDARLTRLYEEQVPGAARLAFLITGDRSVAEDLAHEAFIRVARKWEDIRHPSAVSGYMRTTVVNLARSHFRHAQLERRYLERQRAAGEPPLVDPPDFEQRDALLAELGRLPLRQRTAVVLRYYEDLSEHQTGDAMGCSDAAVRSLVARAMETLRQRLGTGSQR
ncbi:MAG: RNA polymerase sigma factor [Actinomycetota bacterium]